MQSKLTAEIFDIQRGSYVDGPGIRTTVFFKGCNLRCAWCHNPESQSHKRQLMIYADKCIGCKKCAEVCPHGLESCSLCGKCELVCPRDVRKLCGKEYTADEILSEVSKDRLFYDNSGGGVTLSGGECMLRIDFVASLLQKCRAGGIHTAVDTAGHVPFEYFERILPYTDLFLYDFKCFDGDKHRHFTGVDNTLILENLKKLLAVGANIIIRIPVICGVHDTAEEMEQICDFLRSNGRVRGVELLPYHAMGDHKYAAIGMEAQTFSAPDEGKMATLREIFKDIAKGAD